MVPFFRQEGEPIGRNLETIGPEKGQRGAHLLGGEQARENRQGYYCYPLRADAGENEHKGRPEFFRFWK